LSVVSEGFTDSACALDLSFPLRLS
jgi:hypothetical protein